MCSQGCGDGGGGGGGGGGPPPIYLKKCRAIAKTQMGRKWERRKKREGEGGIKVTRETDEIHHVSGATSRFVPLCVWCNYKHCTILT